MKQLQIYDILTRRILKKVGFMFNEKEIKHIVKSIDYFRDILMEKKLESVRSKNEKYKDKSKKDLDFGLLNQFLSENIFKIEKKLNGFIKNINLIIERNFLEIKISIKKDNHHEIIDKNVLNYLLGDAKRQVKENYRNHEIIMKNMICLIFIFAETNNLKFKIIINRIRQGFKH